MIKNYNALGLFDGILICHYDEKRKKYYMAAKKENKYNVFKMNNDEIIVVDNETIELF